MYLHSAKKAKCCVISTPVQTVGALGYSTQQIQQHGYAMTSGRRKVLIIIIYAMQYYGKISHFNVDIHTIVNDLSKKKKKKLFLQQPSFPRHVFDGWLSCR